jgi:predicted RND superfamily exporter protein
VRARDGNIFTPHFFETLRQVTDAVLFMPGIDRSTVRSLFTPDVRFVEIVEGGFAGGTVIPADFRPTAEGLARVRENVVKADLVGRLVADDFSAALISAELIEPSPHSPELVNDLDVARRLERSVRAPFVDDQIDIHILGFAKAVGDIAEGAVSVVAFFGVTVLITAALVYLFVGSVALTALALASAMIAVVWTLGLMPLLAFGLDPMSILLPFLIFAIAVSHGLQMIGAYAVELTGGADRPTAARLAFRKLLLPGSSALATDLLGFLTIALIGIRMLEELAIAAALGVLSIILTSLVLLPILLSLAGPRYLVPGAKAARLPWVERAFARFASPRVALVTLLLALVLLVFGTMTARELQIGELRPGIAELRPDARYNQDNAYISGHFRVGVDLLQVMVETLPNGCIDYDIMAGSTAFNGTWRTSRACARRARCRRPPRSCTPVGTRAA